MSHIYTWTVLMFRFHIMLCSIWKSNRQKCSYRMFPFNVSVLKLCTLRENENIFFALLYTTRLRRRKNLDKFIGKTFRKRNRQRMHKKRDILFDIINDNLDILVNFFLINNLLVSSTRTINKLINYQNQRRKKTFLFVWNFITY